MIGIADVVLRAQVDFERNEGGLWKKITPLPYEKAYWLARTPSERLQQVEILRRINDGHSGSA
jgi:hypothetical protein